MPVTVRGTDILFNDATTQSTAAVVNTTSVLNATAGASVGAVGTYAFLRPTDATNYSEGSTLAGSSMRYQGSITASSGHARSNDGGTPAGTWRAMGRRFMEANPYGSYVPDQWGATLWLRIS